MALDTDVVGPFGYYTDFPCTFYYINAWQDFEAHGYDGVVEPNTTLCIKSYIGFEGDSKDACEGIELEQLVLITETGVGLLPRFPFEEVLPGCEI